MSTDNLDNESTLGLAFTIFNDNVASVNCCLLLRIRAAAFENGEQGLCSP